MLVKIMILLAIGLQQTSEAQAPADKNLFQFNDCLYLYVEEGTYDIGLVENGKLIKDTYWRGKLDPNKITLNSDAMECVHPDTKKGKFVFTYAVDKPDLKSIRLSMILREKPFDRYWEVDETETQLIGLPNNPKIELSSGISADSQYSYACAVQQFRNLIYGKMAREYVVTFKLNKFQFQPFTEGKTTIFVDAQDCTVWLTIPTWMGLALTIFIVVVVSIGAYFLQEITTTDLKYSKAGMLMNPSQLDATK